MGGRHRAPVLASRHQRLVQLAVTASDYDRIVGEMGVPVATTVWSFVILGIVIAVPVWLVLKFSNRAGRSSDMDEHDDTPR